MSHSASRIPELLLEQLSLGEISAHDERWLREQLPAEEIERRLAMLRAADARHEQRRGAAQMVDAIKARRRVIEARAEVARKPLRSWQLALPGLAAALLVLFVVVRPSGDTLSPDQVQGPDTTRVKGLAHHLVLHRRAGNDAETLANNARAKRGDVLQLGYVAAKARYGVILSIDGGGTVTLHFPEHERASTELLQGGEQLLPNAYQLDDAPQFERFFFVTSARPLDAAQVLEEARTLSARGEARTGALSLKSSIDQQSLILVKE